MSAALPQVPDGPTLSPPVLSVLTGPECEPDVVTGQLAPDPNRFQTERTDYDECSTRDGDPDHRRFDVVRCGREVRRRSGAAPRTHDVGERARAGPERHTSGPVRLTAA